MLENLWAKQTRDHGLTLPWFDVICFAWICYDLPYSNKVFLPLYQAIECLQTKLPDFWKTNVRKQKLRSITDEELPWRCQVSSQPSHRSHQEAASETIIQRFTLEEIKEISTDYCMSVNTRLCYEKFTKLNMSIRILNSLLFWLLSPHFWFPIKKICYSK